jgi:hypothetical protein
MTKENIQTRIGTGVVDGPEVNERIEQGMIALASARTPTAKHYVSNYEDVTRAMSADYPLQKGLREG